MIPLLGRTTKDFDELASRLNARQIVEELPNNSKL